LIFVIKPAFFYFAGKYRKLLELRTKGLDLNYELYRLPEYVIPHKVALASSTILACRPNPQDCASMFRGKYSTRIGHGAGFFFRAIVWCTAIGFPCDYGND
jgi:hypothetical protein